MRRFGVVLLGMALGAGSLTLVSAHPSGAQVKEQVAARAREYRVIDLTGIMLAGVQKPEERAAAVESKFNELGRDGWEFGALDGVTAVFQRPKP